MSLMAKLRAPALGMMLGAASLGFFGGCTTITPWERVRTEEKQIGAEIITTKNIGTKTIDMREFYISDAYLQGGEYRTDITESLTGKTYKLEESAKVKRVRETGIEERKKQTEVVGPFMFGLFTTVGAVGGWAVGNQLDEESTLKKIGCGALGAVIGAGLSALLAEHAPVATKVETRRGEGAIREVVSDKKVNETFLKQDSMYSGVPGANAKFGFEGNSQTYITQSGTIPLQDKVLALPIPSYWFPTKKILEEKLSDFSLIREIKPAAREILKDKLLDASTERIYEFVLETREQALNNNLTIIKNASKKLKLNGYELSDRAIYNVIEQFVDEKINPSIKTLSFAVKEDLTHVSIRGSNFELQTDAPTKAELLDKYFTGGLKKYSERFISDYLTGTLRAEDCPDKVEFPVYSPSNIFLEVTNPDYNFVSGEIKIKGDMKKTIYMIDKGSKVRIQKAGESQGRIE